MGGGCSKEESLNKHLAPPEDADPVSRSTFLSPVQEEMATNADSPIRLAAQIPTRFTPYKSPPKQFGELPYKRLVILSSRVHDCIKVAEHVLPNVAVVAYDWRVYTLQELLRAVKKVLSGGKVLSIAVVAPSSEPGCVGLLEGCSTSAKKLELLSSTDGADGPHPSHPLMANASEIAQFWRVLSNLVTTNERGEGRRVDLIGCRLEEAPVEGAALLRALTELTTVPFATSDDAKSGYQLSTHFEHHSTQRLALRLSPVKALSLYFDKMKLLGIPLNGKKAGAAPGVQPDKDIFNRFAEGIRRLNMPLTQIFQRFDTSQTGLLSTDEVHKLVRAVCPEARRMDVEHVASMLDLDGNDGVSLVELKEALDQDSDIEKAVSEL